MARFTLSRRTILRAAGQAAIALPSLEIMSTHNAPAATTALRRFVLMFCGSSLGQNGQREPCWTPKSAGAGYPITRDLAPIGASNAFNRFGAYGVQDEVSIVSGLSVPWVKDGEAVPP